MTDDELLIVGGEIIQEGRYTGENQKAIKRSPAGWLEEVVRCERVKNNQWERRQSVKLEKVINWKGLKTGKTL